MTDKEFDKYMSAMASGDRDVLKHIYEEYVKLVYAVIYDTIKSREEAEDITSEFFIKLCNIAEKYKPGNGHKKWLVTVAKNMAIDRIRKLDREIVVDEFMENEPVDEDIAEQAVLKCTMKQVMQNLKPEERQVLDLKVIGGFTFKDISDLLEKPQGTISWLYNSAIKKLRRCQKWD
ncbi:MAG: RNA polymerase sigma factor [Coprococcus sp.]